MKMIQTSKITCWIKNRDRTRKSPLISDYEENVSLKRLAEEIVQLIEETTTLQVVHNTKYETSAYTPRVNVLKRTDRSAAFLAGYSSKGRDCPFHAEDVPTRCLVTAFEPSKDNSGDYDCLGLVFYGGVPCKRLWRLFALEKDQNQFTLFDLP